MFTQPIGREGLVSYFLEKALIELSDENETPKHTI
jgi:hypothetical protein